MCYYVFIVTFVVQNITHTQLGDLKRKQLISVVHMLTTLKNHS